MLPVMLPSAVLPRTVARSRRGVLLGLMVGSVAGAASLVAPKLAEAAQGTGTRPQWPNNAFTALGPPGTDQMDSSGNLPERQVGAARGCWAAACCWTPTAAQQLP